MYVVTVMSLFWSPVTISCFRLKYNDCKCRQQNMEHTSMQSPSVSSTKYGNVSWARYRCTIVYAYFLSGRLRVWCGGHIISSCGGSTWRLMGRFHPAPHIGWTETCYTKTHVEDSSYNTKLPESWRILSPLVISRLYMICNPRPLVCYTSLGASSSIV